MSTTFTLTNLKTKLAINMTTSNVNQVAELYTPEASDAWEEWRFQMTDTETGDFTMINAKTGMPLSISEWMDNSYFQVLQFAAGSTGVIQWTVRPASGAHAGAGYYEIILPAGGQSQDVEYYVMKIANTIIGTGPHGSSLGLPLEASWGNGGLENELWTIANTASPPPSITFNINAAEPDPDQIGQYGAILLPVSVSNYSGKSVSVLTLPIPGTGALTNTGVGFSGLAGPTAATAGGGGTFNATLTIPLIAGSPPNPAPLVTMVALDDNNFAIAFAQISSQYWYQQYW